jgi:hypothetical protein
MDRCRSPSGCRIRRGRNQGPSLLRRCRARWRCTLLASRRRGLLLAARTPKRRSEACPACPAHVRRDATVHSGQIAQPRPQRAVSPVGDASRAHGRRAQEFMRLRGADTRNLAPPMASTPARTAGGEGRVLQLCVVRGGGTPYLARTAHTAINPLHERREKSVGHAFRFGNDACSWAAFGPHNSEPQVLRVRKALQIAPGHFWSIPQIAGKGWMVRKGSSVRVRQRALATVLTSVLRMGLRRRGTSPLGLVEARGAVLEGRSGCRGRRAASGRRRWR